MKKRNKKIMVTLSIIVLFLIASTLAYFWHAPKNYSNVTSYTNYFGGYSQYRLLRKGGENGVLYFCDFESSNEVVFCTKPQCQHKDNSCFAYSLIHETEAQNITLYEKKLYYTTYKYDFNTDYKWSITLHESSTDGATSKVLATFKGYDSCDSLVLTKGYTFLSLRKYDDTQEAINSENERYSTKLYAQVNIKNGKVWYFPEKQGYHVLIDFIGVEQNKLYYVYSYSTTAMTVGDLTDVEAREDLQKKSKDALRVTLLEVNIETHTEDLFLDEYTEMTFDYYDNIQFAISKGRINAMPYQFNMANGKYNTMLSSYDINTKALLQEKNFDNESYGNLSLARYNAIIYFPQYNDSGNKVLSLSVYDPISNKMIEIEGLKDFSIFPYGCIGDKIILIIPDSGQTLENLGWIKYTDYLEDNAAEVHYFKKNSNSK